MFCMRSNCSYIRITDRSEISMTLNTNAVAIVTKFKLVRNGGSSVRIVASIAVHYVKMSRIAQILPLLVMLP